MKKKREGLSHCLSSFYCSEAEIKKRVAKARPEGALNHLPEFTIL